MRASRSRSSSSSSAARATASARLTAWMRSSSARADFELRGRPGVRPALLRQGRVERREPAVEIGGAGGGVGPDVVELRADPGELRRDRRQLAVAGLQPLADRHMRLALGRELAGHHVELAAGLAGRRLRGGGPLALGRQCLVGARADRGGVRRSALAGEPHLLGGLLAHGERLGLGGGERLLARLQLLRELVRAGALVARAGERDLVGGAQQLRPARLAALLVELLAQALDARERARVGVRGDRGLRGRLRLRRRLGQRHDVRGRRLERLEPPLQLGAAQLEHLDRLERLRRALRRSALRGLGPARAVLGQHGAVDHLAAALGGRRRRGRRRRRRLDPPLRRGQRGARAALPAEPELVGRRLHQHRGDEVRRAPDRRVAAEARVRQRLEPPQLPAAPQSERGQVGLAPVQVGPAAADADQAGVRARRQPLDRVEREAFEHGDGCGRIHAADAVRRRGGRVRTENPHAAANRSPPRAGFTASVVAGVLEHGDQHAGGGQGQASGEQWLRRHA